MTDSLAEVKRRLVERASLDPQLLDRAWFERILRERLRELGLRTWREYGGMLDRDCGELQRLVEHVSVSETWFFRYPESFRLLVRHLQSLRAEDASPRPLRMLSVACATGEEPYSMAIAAVHAGWSLDQLALDAVDRNARDIAFARLATYPRRALRDDAPDWAAPWFRSDGEHLHVSPAVVNAVHWMVADVLRTSPATLQEEYDVIFCRNLLIYLHDSARQRLIERLADWLAEHGLLFVGHAECTDAMQSRFQFTSTPYAFALRTLPPQPVNPNPPDDGELRRIESRVPPSVGPPFHILNRSTDRAPQPAADARRGQPRAAIRRDSISSAALQQAGSVSATGGPGESAALRDARRLADSGRLAEALEAIEAIIADAQPEAGVYSLLGSVHLAMGNLAAAQEAFLKSLYLAPRCADTLLQLALVYERRGKGPLAARYRHRAAEVHRGTASEEL